MEDQTKENLPLQQEELESELLRLKSMKEQGFVIYLSTPIEQVIAKKERQLSRILSEMKRENRISPVGNAGPGI